MAVIQQSPWRKNFLIQSIIWPDYADKVTGSLFSNARSSGEMPDAILLLRLPEALRKNVQQACANPAVHYPPDCQDKQGKYKTVSQFIQRAKDQINDKRLRSSSKQGAAQEQDER